MSVRKFAGEDEFEPLQRKRHDEAVKLVRNLPAGQSRAGGLDDMLIDVLLRELWELQPPEDDIHIMLELAEAPEGQVIHELFANGIPKQVPGPTGTGAADGIAPAIAVPVG